MVLLLRPVSRQFIKSGRNGRTSRECLAVEFINENKRSISNLKYKIESFPMQYTSKGICFVFQYFKKGKLLSITLIYNFLMLCQATRR